MFVLWLTRTRHFIPLGMSMKKAKESYTPSYKP